MNWQRKTGVFPVDASLISSNATTGVLSVEHLYEQMSALWEERSSCLGIPQLRDTYCRSTTLDYGDRFLCDYSTVRNK